MDKELEINFPFEKLFVRLQMEGFRIGIDTRLNIYHILKELGQECINKPAGLKLLLSPIIAKNKEQQYRFNKIFEEFIQPAKYSNSIKKSDHTAESKRIWRKYISLIILIVMAVLVLIIIKVIPLNNSQPKGPSQNVVDIIISILPDQKAPLIILSSLAFLLGSLYILKKTQKIKILRKFKIYDNPPYELELPSIDKRDISQDKIINLATIMRQRRTSDLVFLDSAKSIRSTIKKGGFPVLEYQNISKPSDYLILIDNEDNQKHYSKLFKLLAETIKQEDVNIEIFTFNKNPQVCYDRFHNNITLDNLYQKFPKHDLIVFSNAEYFISLQSGNLTHWAKNQIGKWDKRIIVSPKSTEEWGYYENILSKSFVLLPANINALMQLVEHLVVPENYDFTNYIIPNPPLNPDLELWLAALSISDKLDWDIILTIGKALQDNKISKEKLLTLENLLSFTKNDLINTPAWQKEIRIHYLEKIKNIPGAETKIRNSILKLYQNSNPPEKSYAYSEKQLNISIQNIALHPDDRNLNAEYKILLSKGLIEDDSDYIIKPKPTPKPKPRLGFWQIWNMSIGFLGIQFGFALQNANASRILQTFGADVEHLSWFWLVAPLTGMIVQPIIGHYSDKTWTRLGRRRPYFLVGAILASIALLFLPNADILASLLPPMYIGAGILMIMDASINVSMEPFRALIADLLPGDQTTLGFSIQTFLIGVGAVFGSWLPYILGEWIGLSKVSPTGGVPDNVVFAFIIGALTYISTVIWTIVKTKEYPPEIQAQFDANDIMEKQTHLGIIQIFKDFANMPKTMKQLGVVQFFSWFALFSMWVFAMPAIAQHHFKVSMDDTYSITYNYAGNWLGILFGVYNFVAMIYAPFLPKIAQLTSRKLAHSISLFIGSAGFLSMYFIKDPDWLIASMVCIGITWASILAMPYAILAPSIPPKKMGIYMGLFNFFITFPQIVTGIFGGHIVKRLYNSEAIYALVFAGIAWIIAGIAVLFVKDKAKY